MPQENFLFLSYRQIAIYYLKGSLHTQKINN